MDDNNVFKPANIAELRTWLKQNSSTSKGVWLIIAKKGHSGVSYEEALQEALCVGWIDSRVRAIDEAVFRQWFSPRKPDSIWSRPNKARVDKLIQEGRMCPAGMTSIETAKANGSWEILEEIDNLVIPPDFQAALDADPAAAANFNAFSDSNRKMILYWFHSAKRPETRARRIAETITAAAKNQLPHH